MSQELLDRINERLAYGDSRSEWVRDAIELKLALLDEIDDENLTDEERREFVIEAVQKVAESE